MQEWPHSSHCYTFEVDFATPPIKGQDCFSTLWLRTCPVTCFGQCAISKKMKTKTEMWLQWSLPSLSALGNLRLPWEDARASLLNDEKHVAQALPLLWSIACQPPDLWMGHARSSKHQIYEWAILDHPNTSQPASWLHMHMSSEISQAGLDLKIYPAYWQSCDCLKALDFGICLLAVQSTGNYTPSPGHFFPPRIQTLSGRWSNNLCNHEVECISERQKGPSKLMSL